MCSMRHRDIQKVVEVSLCIETPYPGKALEPALDDSSLAVATHGYRMHNKDPSYKESKGVNL